MRLIATVLLARWRAILSLLAWLIGILLLPTPKDVDAVFSPWDILGAALQFVGWLLGVVGWGTLLQRKLDVQSDLSIRLALGTALAVAMITILGTAGLIGYSHAWLLWALVLSGCLFLPPRSTRQDDLPRRSRMEDVFVGIFVMVLATRFLQACVPQLHSDPLYYHLFGPKLWVMAGRIYLPDRYPIVFLCSYWEYLITWGQILLGGPGSRGLIESQLFAQWVHVVVGYGGAGLALRALLISLGMSRVSAAFGTLLGLTSLPMLAWTITQAKNDWGIFFWIFAATQLLLSRRTVRDAVVAGLLFGLAIAGKWPAVFSVFPLIVGVAISQRLSLRNMGAVFLGLSATLCPMLARNWMLTGNPVFPVPNPWFDSPVLSTYWKTIWGDFATHAGQDIIWDRLGYLFGSAPALALYAGVLIRAVTGGIHHRAVFLAPLAGFTFVLVRYGAIPGAVDDGSHGTRMLGASLVLMLAFGAAVVCDMGIRVPRGRWIAGCGAVAMACAAIWQSGVAVTAWTDLFKNIAAIPYAISQLTVGGTSKAWLRLNATQEDRIVSTGDNQLYYVSHLQIFSVNDDVTLARFNGDFSSIEELVSELKSRGFRFVLDSRHFENLLWSHMQLYVNEVVKRWPQAVVYSDQGSRIVDLDRISIAAAKSQVHDEPDVGR